MTVRNGLVVGATGGLGTAISRALIDDGWQLQLAGRDPKRTAELANRLGAVSSVTIDLTEPDTIAAAMAAGGDLDGLVQAAGPSISMAYTSTTNPDELGRGMTVEAEGLLRVVQASLDGLRRRRGAIVALTSAGIIRHPSRDVASTAPKAAVEAIVRALAREEGRYGVRANSVAVGVVEAGMFQRLRQEVLDDRWLETARANIALGRFGDAADVAGAVRFLLSDEANYITGQRLVVDGGYSV